MVARLLLAGQLTAGELGRRSGIVKMSECQDLTQQTSHSAQDYQGIKIILTLAMLRLLSYKAQGQDYQVIILK